MQVHPFLQLQMHYKTVVRIVVQIIAKIHAGNIVVWLVSTRTHAVTPALVTAWEHVGEVAIKVAYKLVLAHVAIIAMALVHILV